MRTKFTVYTLMQKQTNKTNNKKIKPQKHPTRPTNFKDQFVLVPFHKSHSFVLKGHGNHHTLQ